MPVPRSMVLGAIDGGMAGEGGAQASSGEYAGDGAAADDGASANSTQTEAGGRGTARGGGADARAGSRAHGSEDECVAKAVTFVQQRDAQYILFLDADVAPALAELDGFAGDGGKGSLVVLEIGFENFDFLARAQSVQRVPGVLIGLGERENGRCQEHREERELAHEASFGDRRKNQDATLKGWRYI